MFALDARQEDSLMMGWITVGGKTNCVLSRYHNVKDFFITRFHQCFWIKITFLKVELKVSPCPFETAPLTSEFVTPNAKVVYYAWELSILHLEYDNNTCRYAIERPRHLFCTYLGTKLGLIRIEEWIPWPKFLGKNANKSPVTFDGALPLLSGLTLLTTTGGVA